MRVLVDVGVGKAVEQYLINQGVDVLAIRNVDPRMEDEAILALAVAEQRLVLTMDKDFGELVVRSGRVHSGVLLLRLDDARGEEKAKVVASVFMT